MPLWALSSKQSNRLITGNVEVRVLQGPPNLVRSKIRKSKRKEVREWRTIRKDRTRRRDGIAGGGTASQPVVERRESPVAATPTSRRGAAGRTPSAQRVSRRSRLATRPTDVPRSERPQPRSGAFFYQGTITTPALRPTISMRLLGYFLASSCNKSKLK